MLGSELGIYADGIMVVVEIVDVVQRFAEMGRSGNDCEYHVVDILRAGGWIWGSM